MCLSLAAQPPKAADYPAHARLSGIEIGARYLPHGLPSGPGVHAAKDLLVVDVGIFPEARSGVNVSKSQFTLSVDDKITLAAQTVGSAVGSVVAAREPSSRDGTVQLGGPPLAQPPGARQEVESAMPRRPISLDPESSVSQARKPALAEGFTSKPVSGYLFFRFDGDPKSIRSLELIYDGRGTKTKIRIL